MLTILKPFLIRIVAAWTVAALSHLARLSGVDYTPDELSKTAAEVAIFLVEWVIPISATIGAIAKVSLDKIFNKANASAAPLIEDGNHLADALGKMEAERKALR